VLRFLTPHPNADERHWHCWKAQTIGELLHCVPLQSEEDKYALLIIKLKIVEYSVVF
jgi:hypothetical protein